MTKETYIKNEPDAARTIAGLRDTGYTFNSACSDIIDNSIAAGADKIIIDIASTPEGKKFVYFGDNGVGMNDAELKLGMRYGAPQREDLASLGKFGLGLKTASTSICKNLTVISRKSKKQTLSKLSWDMDHVVKVNSWENIQTQVSDEEKEKFEQYCGDKGTLVIWSKCDRLFEKRFEPASTQETAAVSRLRKNLIEHIGLHFHRFLDENDGREKNVVIEVNEISVSAWNPFYVEKSKQVLRESHQELPIQTIDNKKGKAHIKAYILPTKSELTKEEETIAKIQNNRQGFYIFREGRVISAGGWANVFGAPEPHGSLLRVEFDFDNQLDSLLKIDIKKSKVEFDPAFTEVLEKLLMPARREAQNVYRAKKSDSLKTIEINHNRANNTISKSNPSNLPKIENIDLETKTVTILNARGRIKLRTEIESNVTEKNVSVEAVDSISSGDLFETVLRSPSESGHQVGVKINKHHDFYKKIYHRAAASGHTVEGIDLLLWAFAAAEYNNANDEVKNIIDEIKSEVSLNLRKLLKDMDLPEADDQ